MIALAAVWLAAPVQLGVSEEFFTRAPVPNNPAALERRLGGRSQAVYRDGDALIFLHRGECSLGITLRHVIPMQRVGRGPIHALRLRSPDWDHALFSYAFLPPGQPRGRTMRIWRGSRAPAPAPQVERLRGKLVERRVFSNALQEERVVSVYLPPGASPGLPTVFMVDAQSLLPFARVLEHLVASGKAPPTAMVGVHTTENRTADLVFGIAPQRSEPFLRFFVAELIPWATQEYGLARSRERRAVFGFSNGANFAATAAIRHPNVFGAALPFSLGVQPPVERPPKPMPRFFLSVGKLEPNFASNTRGFYETLRRWRAQPRFDFYPGCGHDFVLWQLAFHRTLPQVFPRSRRS